MNPFHQDNAALRAVTDLVDEYQQRTGCSTILHFPSFATPTHISTILHNPRYLAYTSALLPSIQFEDLNDLAIFLRNSSVYLPPANGKLQKITLVSPRFRSILSRPVDDFPLVDLELWSDISKPFNRVAFSHTGEIIPSRYGGNSNFTSRTSNLTLLEFSKVSMPQDALYQIIRSCSKLDILTLSDILLTTAVEPPSEITSPTERRSHDLKELSISDFYDAYFANFLRMIRKSSNIKFSVSNLQRLMAVMKPTVNSVLSVGIKHELAILLRDNLFRPIGEPRSRLKELRIICEAFGRYTPGNQLAQVSLTSLIRHSALSNVTLDLWQNSAMPIELLSRIVDLWPTDASLNIVYSTQGKIWFQ
ncbi:uncharacterized protein EV420DRAFT_1695655 [Desarmillaria tabescens]|uniref:Uncharacterized protein n=1 Tax=Armillaria tabescens TaxID=1929756 RepID=A0AA39K452_ARMTA|nr:uncharacterized protein EV420DRAFT_1695655 [Desarmillaria tabescens]KAK0454199.1 hypothetical protein EV420DRAFT_1695655 [Desarmillaria tabescens]